MRKLFKFLINLRSDTIDEFKYFIKHQNFDGCDYLPTFILLYFVMILIGVSLTASSLWFVGIPLLVPFITVPLIIAVGSTVLYIIYKIVSVPFKALSKIFNKVSNRMEKE